MWPTAGGRHWNERRRSAGTPPGAAWRRVPRPGRRADPRPRYALDTRSRTGTAVPAPYRTPRWCERRPENARGRTDRTRRCPSLHPRSRQPGPHPTARQTRQNPERRYSIRSVYLPFHSLQVVARRLQVAQQSATVAGLLGRLCAGCFARPAGATWRHRPVRRPARPPPRRAPHGPAAGSPSGTACRPPRWPRSPPRPRTRRAARWRGPA